MVESSKLAQSPILKFDGFYDIWEILMENLLQSKEYYNMVENGVTSDHPDATLEQCMFGDPKVKNILFQAVDRKILKIILFVIRRNIFGNKCE